MESTLELLAEISIGLVGFAGVVSALGRSRLSKATLSFRIGALLINSVTALVFSILPLLLAAHGVSVNVQWTIATALLVLAQTGTITWSARWVSSLSGEEVPNLIRVVMFSLIVLTIMYELYGIFFDPPSLSSIYIVGVSVSFGIGLFHFCILVLSIHVSTEST